MQTPGDANGVAIERPADLTTQWLTDALGGAGVVTGFTYDRIGTGQMSECYRVTLDYDDGATGPSTVVLKVAAGDPTSRQTGLAMGLYEREVRFYTDIAPGLTGPIAPVYHAAIDPQTGVFDVLLGDAAPAEVGNEIRGATIEQAMLAVTELGRLHGPVLGSSALAATPWLNRAAPLNQALVAGLYAVFAERYGGLMSDDQREVCERLVAGFDGYLEAEGAPHRPMGLVHGDYRLDNMLFGADQALTVVDWQTVTWGPAMTDLAYFLGCALPTDARRRHHDDLLVAYHQALGKDSPLSIDDVRDGVRRQSFFGVMMAIVSSVLVERTERGDEMFMTMLQRHCDQVRDLDALATLCDSTPAPLPVGAGDEGPHAPTGEALWNESWYFDFTDRAQRLGGWVRLGLYPNEQTAWVNVVLCGPDMPTVALNDFRVALPDDPREVHTDTIDLTVAVTEPLTSCRLTAAGQGEAYDDPSALLRGEPGRPVRVSLDLMWDTTGQPYQYRVTSRYEIPCTVTGTVTVDGTSHELAGVPGQRDHSWGVRDWWSMDWVWSAIHLDDGTHVHGVDLRIPGAPPIGLGYVQRAGTPLVELSTFAARETFADNGLPVSTTLSAGPGDLVATADVIGHAPARLESFDGRVAQFPRAWAEVTTADGRRGVGWLEWNRNL